MEREKVRTADCFVLELEALAEFGYFVLDESLWECLRLYSSWIEPLVVNQWIAEMYCYKLNKVAQCSRYTNWIIIVKHQSK